MPRLDHEQLTRCVQSLKERERAVVVMTFYDEQTGADVASFLGVSEANVRVIRHRAIHQLRDCHGGSGMKRCANPIDAGVLADYWLAALASPEEDAVEEHLFELRRMRAAAPRSDRSCRRNPQAGARRLAANGCE